MIDLTGEMATVHPHPMAVATATAQARTRHRGDGRGARSRGCLSGARHARRPAEILTLLCANPEGLGSEELSEGVYGDPARGGSIRVEISRLPKLLGDCIETGHYRCVVAWSPMWLRCGGLLHRGEVREAAARYPGPRLPRSMAPGVAREREAIEGWLRQSVMSAGDQEALLANLAFADPRCIWPHRGSATADTGKRRRIPFSACVTPL